MGPGTVIANRFAIVRFMARGGMADVLEALDRDDGGRSVAVKVLRDKYLQEPEAVARFEREARIVSTFRSRHVAQILAFGTTEKNWPFIAMELLRGRDLSKELSRTAPLPLPRAASYLAQACRAMIEAHERGIVHRDLKPSNLFLVEEREDEPPEDRVLKVLDFGIAKIPESSSNEALTNTRSLFGSPLYMSPETFRSAKLADARSDVWSLGVIFYEMLTGTAPFVGDDPLSIALSVTRGTLVLPTQVRPDLPASVDGVLARALQKDPAERYASMVELLDAIEPFNSARGERRPSVRPSSRPTDAAGPVGSPPPRLAEDADATLFMKRGPTDEDSQPTGPVASIAEDVGATTLTVLKGVSDRPRSAERLPSEPPGESLETGQIARPVELSSASGSVAPPRSPRGLVWAGAAAVALLAGGGWLATRLLASPAPVATDRAVTPAATNAATPTAAATATDRLDEPPPLVLSATHEDDDDALDSASASSSARKPKRRPHPRGTGPRPTAAPDSDTKRYEPEGI